MINISSNTLLADHMLEQSPDVICAIGQTGNFIYANSACRKLLGHEILDLIGRNCFEFISPSDQAKTASKGKKLISGGTTADFENKIFTKSGKEITFSWSGVWSEDEGAFICIGREKKEPTQAACKAHEKEEFYHALIEHGSDLIALLDEEGNYKYVSESIHRIFGFEPSELLGINAFSLIHPDDITKALISFEKALNGETVKVSPFRFRNAANEWRWIETTASNQLINPNINGIVVTSRDVTEAVLSKLKLRENKKRFKALFENNPDLVFYEDKNGVVLDINPAALSYFKVKKNQVVGRPIIAFLPHEAAINCDQKREEVLSGNQVKFELDMVIVGFENLGPVILDLSKIPVEINGSIVGIYTIARDITAIRHSQNTIRQQAKKLNNIFESITDAFFTIDMDWNFTYLNRECQRLLGISSEESMGKNILDVFPEEVNGEFHKKYQYAFETGNSVNFEAYLERNGKWLEVRAFPYQEGLSVYFADVTERVRIEKELEKLSFVASKTSNGVVIMDADGYTEWVNEGFTRLTGFTPSDIIGEKPRTLLQGPDTDIKTAISMSDSMKAGQPFTGEILNYKKTGEEVWFSLSITPVFDDSGLLTKYVVILTDITDKVRYRQKLKELSLVASTSTNGIFITDAERKIEWANDGFTRLTGYTFNEAFGKRPSEFLHSSKTPSEAFLAAKEGMLRGEPVTFDVLYASKDGEDLWVAAEVNPVLNEQGKLIRYISTLTDITALKKSELKLTQLTKDLYRHNRDMQQFTYIVSHNLRSPVANAIGLTNVLNKTDRNSEAFNKSLENLKKCVNQLDAMLKDMNTILSIKDVKETFNQEEVNLSQSLQQVEASLLEPLSECGGKVISDIPVHLSVPGNRAYVHSIFFNLLSNAIKYRSAERNLEVTVSCNLNESGETVLTFADNGSGFDMAKVGSKLFKLYNRFHLGMAEGRGIGLFLVKTHMEALGGRIEVSSQVNKGTTFTIYFK